MTNSDLKEPISKHYQKFFAKFPEIETFPLAEWNKTHILAYICKRYKDYYNLDFTFSFKGTPSKCREMFEVSKLCNQISSDPTILKSYIDWVFDTKIIERKKRITSLAYMTHTDIINEYKFKLLFKQTSVIGRTNILPNNILVITSKYNSSIVSYGDLAFYKKMAGNELLFKELESIGFNINILDEIK